MSRKRFAVFCLYLVILLLALTGLYAKTIPLNAIAIIHLRGIVALLGVGLFSLVRQRSLAIPDRRSCFGVYGLGLLLGIHWATFFHAMQVSSVAVGMLSMFSYPVMTIILEPLFSKKRLQLSDIVAGGVALCGLAIMTLSGQHDVQSGVGLGVFWGMLSALMFALRNLFQKYHFNHLSSDCLMFHQMIVVALMFVFWVDYGPIRQLSMVDMGKIIMLGVFSTAAAHTLLVYCLKQLPVKSVSLITCSQPVVAALLAWWVVDEVPGPAIVIGGMLVLSVSIFESLRKQQRS